MTHRTFEQLRHAIDGGGTGDKVPALDPAAAPFGTDDEASGSALHLDRSMTAPEPPTTAQTPIAADSGRRASGAWVASLAAAAALGAGFLLLLID